jgi:hypothetical protein
MGSGLAPRPPAVWAGDQLLHAFCSRAARRLPISYSVSCFESPVRCKLLDGVADGGVRRVRLSWRSFSLARRAKATSVRRRSSDAQSTRTNPDDPYGCRHGLSLASA